METEALEQSIVLRIVAGEQRGASIELEPRVAYDIGSSQACRISLIGEGIEPVHIEAVFFEGELTILRSAEDVMLDGKPLGSLPVIVFPLQLVSFAGVVFAFGNVDEDWEQVEARAAELGEQSGKSSPDAPKRKVPGPVVATIAAAMIFGLFAVLGTVFWKFAGMSSPEGQEIASVEMRDYPQMEQKVMEIVVANPFLKDKVILKEEEGIKVITGIVDRSEDILMLRQAIGDLELKWNVASRFQLEDELDLVLRDYDNGLVYEISLTDGVVILELEGIADSSGTDEKLKEVINRNIPLIEKIMIAVHSSDSVLEKVDELLTSKGQYATLKQELKGKVLSLSGPLLANYASVEGEVQDILAGFEPHSLEFVSEISLGPNFEGAVSSILISKTSYAIFRFGNREIRAVAGTRLPGGIKLVAVTPSSLIVQHDGIDYHLSRT